MQSGAGSWIPIILGALIWNGNKWSPIAECQITWASHIVPRFGSFSSCLHSSSPFGPYNSTSSIHVNMVAMSVAPSGSHTLCTSCCCASWQATFRCNWSNRRASLRIWFGGKLWFSRYFTQAACTSSICRQVMQQV